MVAKVYELDEELSLPSHPDVIIREIVADLLIGIAVDLVSPSGGLPQVGQINIKIARTPERIRIRALVEPFDDVKGSEPYNDELLDGKADAQTPEG